MEVKISIILPAYNVEKYVRQCLNSIMSQSLQDYEVLMVDDGSTDGTSDILKEFSSADKRFKYIFQENKGPGAARNNAMRNSAGKYIVFMDPDDWYPSDVALETLFDKIETADCFVAGGSLLFYDERSQTVVPDKIKDACFLNDEVVYFRDYQYYYFYTRFIYDAVFLKKNHLTFPEIRRFQDVIFFLNVMSVCKKFRSFPDKVYAYRGNSHPNSFFDKEKVLSWMDGIKTSLLISKKNHWVKVHYKSVMILTYDNFLEASDFLRRNFDSDYEKKYGEIIDAVDPNILMAADCDIDYPFITYGAFYKSYIWSIVHTDVKTRGQFISKTVNRIGSSEFVKALICNYLGDREGIVGVTDLLDHPPIFRKVKTIGIFNEALNVGGVERCISLFIPLFKKMGYNVVLFTEASPDADKFFIDSSVKRVVLPGSNQRKKSEWIRRVDALSEAIRKNDIDVFYYHSYWKDNVIFDELICKMICGIPFILHHHNVFSAMLARNNDFFNNAIQLYSFSDLIIALSNVDQLYFRLNGIPSIYIPNPVDSLKKNTCLPEEHSILWIGRFVPNHKQPLEMLKILNEVKKQIPDVKLYMVGDGEISVKTHMHEYIRDNGLEENVEFTGFISNVEDFYKRCKLMVLTSCIEGFPMVVAECKSYGLPIVAYDLPYVEMIRDPNSGVIRVGQYRYRDAAVEVVHILNDSEHRNRLKEEAVKSLKKYDEVVLSNLWKEVFEYIQGERKKDDYTVIPYSPTDYEILIKTYTYHLKLSKASRIVRNQSTKSHSTLMSLKGMGLFNATKILFKSLFTDVKKLLRQDVVSNSKPHLITKHEEMIYDNWVDIKDFSIRPIDIALSAGEGMKVKYHVDSIFEPDCHMPFDEFGGYSLEVLFGAFHYGINSLFSNIETVPLNDHDLKVIDTDTGLFDLHNFSQGMDLEEEKQKILLREISKLNSVRDKFSNGCKCLIVMCNRSDNRQIINFGENMKKLYPKSEFTIISILNYPELDDSIVYRTLFESRGLHIFLFAANDFAQNDEPKWKGNARSWGRILGLFKI